MSQKTSDPTPSPVLNLAEASNVWGAPAGSSFSNILCTLRWGAAICAFGAHLLLSACAGGGGGSSDPGSPSPQPGSPSPQPDSPSSPPDSSPEPDDSSPDESGSTPPPPSSPPPPPGSPSGQLSIPLGSSVENDLAPLQQTTLRFGGAFGAGPDLGRVIAIDSLGRPHWVELGGRTRAAEPNLNLLNWLSPSGREFSLSGRVRPEFALGLGFSAPAMSGSSEHGRYENNEVSGSFALTADFYGARLSLLRDWGLERHFGFSAEVPYEYNLMGTSALASPYLSIVGTGDGLVVAREIGEDALSLRLGFATEQSPRSAEARGDAEVWVAEMIGRTANNSWIGLQLGSTVEGNRLLGSEGEGAFELPSTSATHFVGLAGSLKLSDRLELFGQGSLGFTNPAASAQGLIEEVSPLRSSSFGLGIAHRDVVTANDRITVALSQPLRVDTGTAVLDRAVGQSPDGHILRQRERISLEPAGRETDIEVGYLLPLGRNVNMSLNWLSQLEPGHNRDASPAHTLALKLRAKF